MNLRIRKDFTVARCAEGGTPGGPVPSLTDTDPRKPLPPDTGD
jgi:hypothetical protein